MLGEITKNIKSLFQWFSNLSVTAKYLFLLISLETLTWTPAFYTDYYEQHHGQISWDDLIVIVTLFSAILAVSRRRSVTVSGAILAVLALGITWGAELYDIKALSVASDSFMAIFFGFVACMILYDLLTTKGVTSDTIIGSICAYMLIGATWTFFYSLTELLVPDSFTLAVSGQEISSEALIHSRNYPLFMYYSFVTLCSLGYGEMIPIKPAARMLATGESIIGQFYMAVFVARLISMYITAASEKIKK